MVGMPREILKIGTKLTNHKGVYTILGDNGLKKGVTRNTLFIALFVAKTLNCFLRFGVEKVT